MTENDLNFLVVLLIAYLLPAVILWAVLLVDTRRGRIGPSDFLELATLASCPLVNIAGLFALFCGVLYRAAKPK